MKNLNATFCRIEQKQLLFTNPKVFKTFKLLVLLLAAVTTGQAANITWDGSSNKDWTRAANWEGNTVPGPADNVLIPAGVPNYPEISTSVGVRAMYIQEGATLSILLGGQLAVNGSLATGISVRGQLINYGSLKIDNTGATGLYISGSDGNAKVYLYGNTEIGTTGSIAGDGILVTDELVMDKDPLSLAYLTPTLAIDQVGGNGISCDQCTASIRQSGSGLTASTTKVLIGTKGSIGNIGLFNSGDFSFVGGTITIQRSGTDQNGLTNATGGNFTMGSDATLNVGSASRRISWHGIENNDQFSSAGLISINNTFKQGIHNTADGTFNNSGDIAIATVAYIGGSGIENDGYFNASAGSMTIGSAAAKISARGIDNYNQFLSAGSLTINNTEGTGIYMSSATFRNAGNIELGKQSTIKKHGIFLEKSSNFVNDGSITVENVNHAGIGVDESIFTNNSAGELSIGRVALSLSEGIGIIAQNNATFYNQGGLIDIDNSAKHGIYVGTDNIFENNDGGQIILTGSGLMVYGIFIYAGGAFTNSACSGIFQYGTSSIAAQGLVNKGYIIDASPIKNEISTNDGIVQNLNGGNFLINNNNGILTNEAGIVWTGCKDTDWHDPGNWVGHAVPGTSDGALILPLTNQPEIRSGTTAGIQALTVVADAELKNNGTLQVQGATGNGIENKGKIYNQGRIRIDGTGQAGIYNTGGAQFYNQGLAILWMGYDDGNLGTYGLHNTAEAVFNNLGGTVFIDNTGSHAVLNDDAYLANFTNANFNIGLQAGNIGGTGIRNTSSKAGIYNSGSTIRINHASTYGIRNEALLRNEVSAEIIISEGTNLDALYNAATGTLSNLSCSILSLSNSLNNQGTVNNEGYIYLNTDAAHTNSGTLNNDGVLSYSDYPLVPNVLNNDIIAQPLLFDCSGVAGNVLDIGGSNSFTVSDEWFNDSNLTEKAGNYDPATNTFTATNLTMDGLLLYFTATNGDCTFKVAVAVTDETATPGQKIWTGTAADFDWHNRCNWFPLGVPTEEDHVVIPRTGYAPVIGESTSAFAKSVSVNNTSLAISSGAILTIDGYAAGQEVTNNQTYSLLVQGRIDNRGTIRVGANAPAGYYGIFNTNEIINYLGSSIHIDRASGVGLVDLAEAVTENHGLVLIGAIGGMGPVAIENLGVFYNQVCTSRIDISSNSTISNSGSFTNNGVITENATGNSSISTNNGIVQNLNGGTFSITTNDGALTTAEGTLWTGCVSTDWHTANNWSDGSVPTATDKVVIVQAANDPTISAAAVAQSVQVESGTSLTINSGASLTIDGYGKGNSLTSNQTFSLLVASPLYNHGTIRIGANSLAGYYGIFNASTLQNRAGGSIYIDRATEAGLYINFFATLENEGDIRIGAQGTMGPIAIENYTGGQFLNSLCTSRVDIPSNSTIVDRGSFINNGIIIENATGKSSISTNNGIVQNLNGGTFSITTDNGAVTTAEGILWTGCDDTNWHTTGNWLEEAVPTTTDKVVIVKAANDPTISSDAVAQSVHVESGAALTVSNSGSLGINGAGAWGLRVYGSLVNNGTLRLDNTGEDALVNYGSTINRGNLYVGQITGIGRDGIVNQDGGTFEQRSGQILIDNTRFGINVSGGSVVNQATIEIGQLAQSQSTGLLVGSGGAYDNQTGSTLQIDNINGNGITLASSMTNAGRISIGQNGPLTGSGITSNLYSGQFINASTGTMVIDNTNDSGLNTITGGFSNFGTVAIGAQAGTEAHGISNQTTFTNEACASIDIYNSLDNEYGTFVNDGHLLLGTAENHTVGNFTNNGLIEDTQATLPAINNQEIIIAPVTSDNCQNIHPAFRLGNTLDLNFLGVYTNGGGGQLAGTYIPATNTFVPNSALSVGTHNFFVRLEDTGNGCTYNVLWRLIITDCCPVTVTCYLDADGDNYGDPSVAEVHCTSCTDGYVADNTDCDDEDPAEFPGQIWYEDADNDNYTSGNTQNACERPNGYKTAAELVNTSDIDCDDADPAVNPNATCAGTTRTWTGSISFNWSDPCNWSPSCVPGATDDVIIPDVVNAPVIDGSVVIKSVEVQSGATLNIATAGSLTIDGSSGTGLENTGTVLNFGHIFIGPSIGVNGAGLHNTGILENHEQGAINLGSTAIAGLSNEGTLTNNGSISTDRSIHNLTGGVLQGTGDYTIVTGWRNEAIFLPGTSTVRFVGGIDSEISGSLSTNFYNLAVEKLGDQVRLKQAIQVDNELQMLSGPLDLNGYDLTLGSTDGTIVGESSESYIYGYVGGEIIKATTLDAPSDENPGNIGVSITSTKSLGTTIIRRSHVPQQLGGTSGIDRYYEISPANNMALEASARFYYLDHELNGHLEADLAPYRYNGTFWGEYPVVDADATANYVATSDIQSFGTWTLSTGQVALSYVELRLKVVLQGPYDANTGLMNDGLRTLDLIPATEPYQNGGSSVSSNLLALSGNDAIVDWVLVELRSAVDPMEVLYARSALLQRDGDVVDTDGSSPVRFPDATGDNYYVAVQHRNHLGIMSSAAVSLSKTAIAYDFTTAAAQANGTNATVEVDNGIWAMWAGDISGDGQLSYDFGATPARTDLLTVIKSHPDNLFQSATYTFQDYSSYDIDLDGEVSYDFGASPGRTELLTIIKNHPANIFQSATFTFSAQLP